MLHLVLLDEVVRGRQLVRPVGVLLVERRRQLGVALPPLELGRRLVDPSLEPRGPLGVGGRLLIRL